ncbi:MAG TPA: transglutaminase domain-containing protein [Pedobacter sp.]|nr:transglutaminase domain-containing protein [Pedobacter sp.]
MKYYLPLLVFLSLISNRANAQNFEYGKIIGSDVNLKNTSVDSNANAVVIREYGESSVHFDENNGYMYIDFLYHVKIRIFNKNGFKSGNIVIPRRIYSDREDEISELSATTFNYINGDLQRHELDRKSIFTEKVNKYYNLTKFTMPNLKEGSIIEYRYHLKIPYVFNFKSWDFQSDIPKLRSEYIAYIPAIYTYNATLRGSKKLDSTSGQIARECLRVAGKAYDCSRMTYIMKNVPALVEEEYMTAASNFKSAIYYELSDYFDLNSGKNENVTKSWKDVDDELVSEKSFGGQLKIKNVFQDLMPEILKGTTDSLSKANAVYDYIRKNIKFNGFIGIYSENTIKKALAQRSGNTADINLALVSALSAAGLDAEALILSTRANGTVNSLYPILSDFNYVVAKLNIGDNSYLLDATQPYLPIGMLPLQCINGEGRVINLKKPSYWYPLKAAQKESTLYSLDAQLTSEGKINGKMSITSLGYAALRKRQQIGQANSVDEYVEKFDEQMPTISIIKHNIENADSLANPLTETYEIEMKVFDNMNLDQLFYNAFFIDRISKNPFNLNERTYPVDLGSAKEVRITAVIRLPENFSITDKPKDLSMVLANSGGKYVFKAAEEGKVLNYSQLFQLSKPIYSKGEYLALKEFYSRIIQLQKTDFVLKKTK